ncbi:hypothetical protein J0S82_005656, partial [Galemys pyrenaicus]
ETEEYLHAPALHKVPDNRSPARSLPPGLVVPSHLVRGGPGAQVLVQGHVVVAIIGGLTVPAEEAPVRPHVAARHSLEVAAQDGQAHVALLCFTLQGLCLSVPILRLHLLHPQGSWLHSQTWRVAVKPLDLRVIQVAHFHMSGLPEARPGHRGVEIPQGVGAWGPGGVRPVLAGSSWQGTRSDRTQRGEKGNRAGEIGIGLSLPAPDSPAQVSVRVRAAKSSRNRLDGIVICFLQAHGDFLTGKAVLLIGFSGNPQAMGSETWLESGVSRQEDKTQAVRGKLGNPHNTNLGAETLRTTPRDLGLSLSPPLLHQELCQTVSLSPGPGAESAKGPKSRHSMKQ